MLTYILLFSLIAIVILGVIRASKQSQPGARLQKEPFVGVAQKEIEMTEGIEMVGKPRIIRHDRTKPTFTTVETFDADADANFGSDNITTDFPAAKAAAIPELSNSDAPPLFAAKPTATLDKSSTPAENAVFNDVIVVNVLAKSSHPYRGYELLQAMLTVGLRHGKWGIFHRHEEITGRGPILFSLASSVEPGTFDLAKMSSFATPGLTLFMRASSVEDAPKTFEKLLVAAQQLAEELGGTVCDEKRLPLSPEKITWWRKAIDFPSPLVSAVE